MFHKTQEKFFASFLEKPFETIISDWDNFMHYTGKMRIFVNEHKIEIEQKDKKKIEEHMPKLPNLLPFLHKYSQLKETHRTLSEEISKNESELSGFKNKIDSLNEKTKAVENEIAEKREEMERIRHSIDKKKGETESIASEILNKNINLILKN